MNLINKLKSRFSTDIIDAHANYGDETVIVAREKVHDVLKFLKEAEQFDLLLDLCGVDYLGREPRFEVVYHLYSLPKKVRLRIKIQVPEKDCRVKSVVDLWEAANWFEREAYDMFGIRFEGHPKLMRLLMWEGFEGHPLRKDYPIDKRQPIPEPADIV